MKAENLSEQTFINVKFMYLCWRKKCAEVKYENEHTKIVSFISCKFITCDTFGDMKSFFAAKFSHFLLESLRKLFFFCFNVC